MSIIRTAEWVSQGHPDKVADSISDALLSAYLSGDPNSHCGIETAVCKDFVLVMGEVTSNASIDVDKIVRDIIERIGYTYEGFGFKADTVKIENRITTQSPDINMGITRSGSSEDVGAGDQGFSIGYAVSGRKDDMPEPIAIARELGFYVQDKLSDKRDSYFPDLKTQVSVKYNPKTMEMEEIDTVVISQSHSDSSDIHKVRKVLKTLVHEFLKTNGYSLSPAAKIYINPTGRFVLHGPSADSGLTGRKLAVDNYGDAAVIGGGAFSGKDLTKVDRSGAYFARYIAKSVVDAGLADECSVQLSWAIGMKYPVAINVKCREATMPISLITKGIREVFEPTVSACIALATIPDFDYSLFSRYGHFGNSSICGVKIPWEDTEASAKKLNKWMKEHYIPRDHFNK